MLADTDKRDILTNVLKSRLFVNSPSVSVMLKFLVESTINQIDVKESVIGMHLYGDNYSDEKSNARIRVSVYHLRKKLEDYYKTYGKNDIWRLHIEKGQYAVSFIKNNVKTSQSKGKGHQLVIGFLVLVVSALLSIITWPYIQSKPKVWRAFFNNNKETTLFMGDVFGFMGKTSTGNWGWQRDYTINSVDEFYQTLEQNELVDTNIQPANYTYITFMSAEATRKLANLFQNYRSNFVIRRVSKVDVNTIKEQNCIYAGPIKNNNLFVQIFCEQHSAFELRDNQLYYRQTESDTVINLYSSGALSEIAIVSRLKGSANTEQFLFLADHDMGLSATVDFFTDSDSLKAFSGKYLKENESFTAMFKVSGKDRVDLELELLSVEYPSGK